ncbi:endonuclease/exonuclease/phosphatase family protein [Desulfogranum japonicum]|uniref:endonuclease/exonuclease/phosphatase family protein n=1 Tax=Desulfogranum japonicum TaxID=231447 RepID=UPI00040C7BB0|nr:endonuclease/exonuclease/phosphatase family protein [Desulfogranum japonicum]
MKKGLMSVIARLTQLAAAVTILFSILTLAGQHHWILDLFSHFRLHYCIASLACALLLTFLKCYRLAVLMLLITCLNGYHIAPWWFPVKQSHASPNHSLKLLHSNVLTSNRQYLKLLNLAQAESPDLIIAQEINQAWADRLSTLHSQYPYRVIIPRNDNFGIGLYSRIAFSDVQKITWGLHSLPSIQVKLHIKDKDVTLITTHPLPPVSRDYSQLRDAQFRAISLHIGQIHTPVILVGDLNTTMWASSYDLLPHTLHNSRAGFGILPTWMTNYPLLRIPIDHCLLSSEFTVSHMKTGPDIGSDHLPIIVELGF